MALVSVCRVSDIAEGKGRIVEAGRKRIAVFRKNGGFFAIGNECPHAGGSLGDGELQDVADGCAVVCPLHGYMFNIKTGRGENFPKDAETYKVIAEEGNVKVEV